MRAPRPVHLADVRQDERPGREILGREQSALPEGGVRAVADERDLHDGAGAVRCAQGNVNGVCGARAEGCDLGRGESAGVGGGFEIGEMMGPIFWGCGNGSGGFPWHV